MHSSKRTSSGIHRIREFELEKIHLADEFDILQIVGEGWFGKILLVEHRASDTEMVLKALPKPYVSLRDFYREFHYGLHLGTHKNIVTTYDVAFETAGFYVFTQEYAPLGDLTSNISESGIGELHSKRVAKQIASALIYMHSKEIVHRDIKLDNVLIYRSDFSRVKLCDFGESHKFRTIVERRNEWLPYSPPEVLKIETEGTYEAHPGHDVWQFGIVIFVCLTGCLPWQKASSDDPRYMRYFAWQSGNMMIPLRRTPKLFKLLSTKGAKMFRKFLEPRPDRRPSNLSDLSKFADDRWLAKGAEKDLAGNEQDELCPSMYSFHSSPEEKNKLLSTLVQYNIETTVDRVAKKNRIRDWIESSVITEEDEDDDSGTATPSSTMSREPVAGHISSIRAEEAQTKINTTLKDAANKHFDPRTGAIQTGPSEMGTIYRNQSLPNIYRKSSTSSLNNGNGSVPGLANRNAVILSEGESYRSELNLEGNLGDDTATNSPEPLVNARLSLPINNNSNNNSQSISNIQYNESVSLNFPKQAINKIHQKQINKTQSVSSLLPNNNNHHSNYNEATQKAYISTYNSLATISMSKNNDDTNLSMHQLNITSNINANHNHTHNINTNHTQHKSSSGIVQDTTYYESNAVDSLANINQISSKESNTSSNSSNHRAISYNNVNHTTMKDTPYDRFQLKKK